MRWLGLLLCTEESLLKAGKVLPDPVDTLAYSSDRPSEAWAPMSEENEKGVTREFRDVPMCLRSASVYRPTRGVFQYLCGAARLHFPTRQSVSSVLGQLLRCIEKFGRFLPFPRAFVPEESKQRTTSTCQRGTNYQKCF